MKILVVLALATVSVVGIATGRANAQLTCRQQAKADYKSCKTDCRSDFTDARAACLGVSPGCFAACLDGRKECIDTAEQPLTDCLALCQPPLDAAKAACRTQCGCGGSSNPCGFNPCFIGCVNPAEDVAFLCRNACRDAFRLNTAAQAAIAACKTGFRSCVDACPPASVSPAFIDR